MREEEFRGEEDVEDGDDEEEPDEGGSKAS